MSHLIVNLNLKGPCSDCPLETSMRCLCGHMDINMKCAELALKGVARCLKRCSKVNELTTLGFFIKLFGITSYERNTLILCLKIVNIYDQMPKIV